MTYCDNRLTGGCRTLVAFVHARIEPPQVQHSWHVVDVVLLMPRIPDDTEYGHGHDDGDNDLMADNVG